MKPLTIEQLKALKFGEWIWLKSDRTEGYAKIVSTYSDSYTFFTDYNPRRSLLLENYGKTWLAYKNKEQAEAKGEIVELLCRVGDTVYIPWVWEGESDVATLIIECIVMKDDGEDFWLCLDLETDDYEFVIKYRNHLMADYGKTWFTDKSEAERKLAELKGE